jgi:protoheme IX farnesyltransferase
MIASAGASAYNHYFDMDIDRIMRRTRSRPIPLGEIKPVNTLLLATIFLLLSMLLSIFTLNFLVAVHLFFGAFIYVVVYTIWLKRRSCLNIVIGGAAGSFAVLAGGASDKPEVCLPPILLAIILFFWTPSHFWTFALFHKEDYQNAGIPMLPVVVGDKKAAFFILLNTIFLFISALLPSFFGNLGILYLIISIPVGIFFIIRNIQLLLNTSKEIAWKNFKASMIYLSILLTAIILDITVTGIR